MSEGLLAVLLGTELEVEVQLRWARRLAVARGLDVLVYERDQRAEGLVATLQTPAAPDEDGN